MLWDKIKAWMPLLAGILVISCTLWSVWTYVPAKYELAKRLEAEPVLAAEEESETQEEPEIIELPDKEEHTEPVGDSTLEKIVENQKYKDGIYYGSGTGFAGELTVKVTIEKGKIVSIEVVSYADGDNYVRRAQKLLSSIISKQSTNVDTVSGATYSSTGLIKAVRAALAKAKADDMKKEKKDKKDQKDKKDKDDQKEERTLSGEYENGTYEGSGKGYLGGITKVRIRVRDNRITKIVIVSNHDTQSFFVMAKDTIIKRIINMQTTEVDAVSNATFSSNGIKSAVADALSKAKKNAGGGEEEPVEDQPVEDEPEEEEENDLGEPVTYSNLSTWVETGESFDSYAIYLDISVLNGKIKSIVFSQKNRFGGDENNQSYSEYALSTLMELLYNKKSTAGIDTVSGATYSSRAIMTIVEQALERYQSEMEGQE